MTQESKRNLGSGKWKVAGVPHKGWHCDGVTDLGEGNHTTCEMCEAASIRYVHHMSHPDCFDMLDVGCVCAGHMEEDYAAAEARDKGMRSAAAKVKREATKAAKTAAAAAKAEAERIRALEVQRQRAEAERQRVEAKARATNLPVADILPLEHWCNHGWGRSMKGNRVRTEGGFTVTVFKDTKTGKWKALVSFGDQKHFSRKVATNDRGGMVLAFYLLREVRLAHPEVKPQPRRNRIDDFAEACGGAF